MAKGYHHMTREQRSQIQVLMSIGMSYKQIAQALGFDKASIGRELKRNSNNGVYDFEFADKASKNKRSSSPPNPAKIVGETAEIIRKLLQKNWSPEQISGRLKLDGICIGRQTIYNYIWEDKESGGTLYTCLRHRGKKYNKRSSKTSGRGLIPNRVDIKERPKIVESKTQIGDFQGDTIIGANHKGAIVSIVDRGSKFTLLKKVPRKQTELVIQAITDKLKNIPRKVLSIMPIT